MNFKPTIWKSIGSFLISIILTIIFGFVYSPCGAITDTLEGASKVCKVSLMLYVIFLFVSFIIIYIIWSLIEKKK